MLTSTLAGGGDLGAMMRAKDWASTSLGPVEGWPESLRTSVSLCLNSRFALLVWWGPDLVMVYNDAYRPILGNKHPASLGQRGRDCWPEVWPIIGPMLEQAYVQGEATWSDDLLLLLDRDGYPEECYFTFSYSPIRDESGIVGVFTPVQETTSQVVRARRLKTLGELGTRATRLATADAVCSSLAILAQDDADVCFALYYEGEDGSAAALRGEAGLPTEALREASRWPLGRIDAARRVLEVPVDTPFTSARWGVPVRTAAVLHVPLSSGTPGFLVVGLSPRRRLDDEYREFLQMAASSLAAAVNDAEAYESERRRAEALAALDRAKTIFFGNISHEFRTPLTLLKAPLEELLEAGDGADPATRARLEIAHRNAERLQHLVNTLLDFARLEAGRLQPRFQSVDLAALTRDVAEGFRPAVERGGLVYVVSCEGRSTVDVDVEMWERIVANLISNAFKFTLEGCVSVRLEADEEVRLEVRDTGAGIDVEHVPHVFDRFHRVPGVQSRSAEGTGIGLALVAELVHLHGGTIGVESTVGEGTVFRLRMPRVQGVRRSDCEGERFGARHVLHEAERWDDRVLPAAGKGQGHVLVVDDNRDMRDYMVALLGERHHVTTAADGEQGLRAASLARPDVILADVMMPVLDGFGFLAALRSDPSLADIPVILVSARAGDDSRLEGLEAGADDYLVKPFSPRELQARVWTQIAMNRLRRDLLAAEREARGVAEEARQRVERLADVLRQHQDTLETTVAERTRELQEANLRLMQVDRLKSEFIASVSHELRTPSTASSGSPRSSWRTGRWRKASRPIFRWC